MYGNSYGYGYDSGLGGLGSAIGFGATFMIVLVIGVIAAIVLTVVLYRKYVGTNDDKLASFGDKSTWGPFLRFDRLAIDTILRALYLFFALLEVVVALALVLGSISLGAGGFFAMLLFCVIGLVVGEILLRLGFERTMLNVIIANNTNEIKEHLGLSGNGPVIGGGSPAGPANGPQGRYTQGAGLDAQRAGQYAQGPSQYAPGAVMSSAPKEQANQVPAEPIAAVPNPSQTVKTTEGMGQTEIQAHAPSEPKAPAQVEQADIPAQPETPAQPEQAAQIQDQPEPTSSTKEATSDTLEAGALTQGSGVAAKEDAFEAPELTGTQQASVADGPQKAETAPRSVETAVAQGSNEAEKQTDTQPKGRYCIHCGHLNIGGARFCAHCGSRLV